MIAQVDSSNATRNALGPGVSARSRTRSRWRCAGPGRIASGRLFALSALVVSVDLVDQAFELGDLVA